MSVVRICLTGGALVHMSKLSRSGCDALTVHRYTTSKMSGIGFDTQAITEGILVDPDPNNDERAIIRFQDGAGVARRKLKGLTPVVNAPGCSA